MPATRAVAVRKLCIAHPLTTSYTPPPRTVLVIAGPTGAGKTGLSLGVARRIDGIAEIISADSVQVYRGLDIGSAKLPPDPSIKRGPREWRSGIRHHLIDIARAEWDYSAGEARWSANAHARHAANTSMPQATLRPTPRVPSVKCTRAAMPQWSSADRRCTSNFSPTKHCSL